MKRVKRIIQKVKSSFNYKTVKLLQNYNESFPIVYKVKDETYERINLSEVFEFIGEINTTAYCLPIYILDVENARISLHSDVVQSEKGAIWDKSISPVFSKVYVQDVNVISYDNSIIRLRKAKHTQYIKGKCVSLLGANDDIWAHFILQFMSKLSFLIDAKLLDSSTSVIMPPYKDLHIKRIVDDILKPYGVKYVFADENSEYICEHLFFVPTAINISNHYKYLIPSDCVFSDCVREAIKKVAIVPYQGLAQVKQEPTRKIYLIRRSGTYRELVNWERVESLFANNGFELVEPSQLSFEEKIQLFSNADVIAGPYSSAFINTIWCKETAKVLILSNIPCTMEATLTEIAYLGTKNVLFVTGNDVEKNNPHTSFYIDESRIIKAYQKLVNENLVNGDGRR